MTHLIHRRGTLHAGLAWGLAMALPSARACEFVTSNLTVVHPWVRATAARKRTFSATLFSFS